MAVLRGKSVSIAVAIALAVLLAFWLVPDDLLRRRPIDWRDGLPAAAAGTIDFQTDIRPILAENCFSCHGPKAQRAQLRLDRRISALGEAGRRSVIVPGDARRSLLIERVARGEMPPSISGNKLTAEEIGRLIAWIDQGAVWTDPEEKPEE